MYPGWKICLLYLWTFTGHIVMELCFLWNQKLCRQSYAKWLSRNYEINIYWCNIISYLLFVLFLRLLFKILSDEVIQSNKTKIIIFCKKEETDMVNGSKVLKMLLEKELYVFGNKIFHHNYTIIIMHNMYCVLGTHCC